MALEDILKLIKEEADSEGKRIIADAETEAEAIKDNAREEAKKEEKRLLEYYKMQAEKEKSRIVDNAKLDIKKKMLREKRHLLDLLYGKAIEKFQKLSRDEYISLIKKLILENTVTKKEEIIISKKEKHINQAFIDGFNKQNKGFNISLSDNKGDFEGGFLLKAEKQQVACTFEALISLIKEEYEVELSRIYFGEEK